MTNWSDLSTQEKNAWVAENVMGWRLIGSPLGGLYPGEWVDADGNAARKGDIFGWNPTADRNDCAEAVEEFCERLGMDKPELIASLDDGLSDYGYKRCKKVNALLLDPDDICRAMYEALNESEDDDEKTRINHADNKAKGSDHE